MSFRGSRRPDNGSIARVKIRLGNEALLTPFLSAFRSACRGSGHALIQAAPRRRPEADSAALPLATERHLQGDGARGPHGPEAPPCDTPAPAPATTAACEGPRGQEDVNVPRAPSRTPPPRGFNRGAGRYRHRLVPVRDFSRSSVEGLRVPFRLQFLAAFPCSRYTPGVTDMEVIAHWRKGSRDALDAAILLERNGKFELALFHCHLAVEKALKVTIMETTKTAHPKTHELSQLASLLSYDWSQEDKELFYFLTEFSVAARYDDPTWSKQFATAENAKQWIAQVEAFLSRLRV